MEFAGEIELGKEARQTSRVAELNHKAGRSGDLVFAKDTGSSKTQASYVVNKADVGKAVTASFNLTHK